MQTGNKYISRNNKHDCEGKQAVLLSDVVCVVVVFNDNPQ